MLQVHLQGRVDELLIFWNKYDKVTKLGLVVLTLDLHPADLLHFWWISAECRISINKLI